MQFDPTFGREADLGGPRESPVSRVRLVRLEGLRIEDEEGDDPGHEETDDGHQTDEGDHDDEEFHEREPAAADGRSQRAVTDDAVARRSAQRAYTSGRRSRQNSRRAVEAAHRERSTSA